MAKRGAVIFLPRYPVSLKLIPACASLAHALYGAADGGVVEAKHIGMMARYRELEHNAVPVERSARHNGDVIRAGKVEKLAVAIGRALDGDGSLAC